MAKKSQLGGFLDFVREQGVVGLAVGFILGGAVSRFVSVFTDAIINPLLSFALGRVDLGSRRLVLIEQTFEKQEVALYWGQVISVGIDLLVIAAVVYFGVKGLGLDKLDKKK